MRSAFVDLFLLGEIPARLQSKSPFHVRMERGLFSCAHNSRFSPPIPLPPSPEPPEAPGGIQNIEVAIPRELFKGRASREVDGSSRNSPLRARMEGACVSNVPGKERGATVAKDEKVKQVILGRPMEQEMQREQAP